MQCSAEHRVPQARELDRSVAVALSTLHIALLAASSASYSLPAMASSSVSALLLFLCLAAVASAQLSPTFYDTSCPNALSTIKSAVNAAVQKENRMGASLLRLHFHDCFVQASSFPFSITFSFICLTLVNFMQFIRQVHSLSRSPDHNHVPNFRYCSNKTIIAAFECV